jgi:uncharacterized cupin superfamily protein
MTVSIGVAQIGPSTSPLHIRLRSLDSGGELGVVELEMPPGIEGPPLHVHPTHGEGFYVLAELAEAERLTRIVRPPIPRTAKPNTP